MTTTPGAGPVEGGAARHAGISPRSMGMRTLGVGGAPFWPRCFPVFRFYNRPGRGARPVGSPRGGLVARTAPIRPVSEWRAIRPQTESSSGGAIRRPDLRSPPGLYRRTGTMENRTYGTTTQDHRVRNNGESPPQILCREYTVCRKDGFS